MSPVDVKHRISTARLGIAGIIASALWSGPALGAVCVQVDQAKDNLSPQDQAGTRTLLEATLRDNGQEVVPAPCDKTFTVYHVKLGKRVNAVISTGEGTRKATASSLEEVPDLYDQMVKSLLMGLKMGTGGPTLTRNTVTKRQAHPRRAEADSLWFVRLGAGTIVGGDFLVGPSLGFGYRFELDWLGIEASGNVMIIHDDDETQIGGSWIRLMGLYFFNPILDWSLYTGLGLSWGGSALIDDSQTYSRSGLQGEVVIGLEMLRSSTIRAFIEIGSTLPFYETEHDGGFRDAKYTPSFSISLGAGWSRRRNKVTVVHVDD